LGPYPRRRCRRLPSRWLRHHFRLGRPRCRGNGRSRRRHDGRGTYLLCSRRGRLLLGGRRIGLTPRSHNNCFDQGVKHPLGLPPLLGLGPWCPSPRHWLDQPTWRLARRPLAQPWVRAEAKSGCHVVVFVVIIIIIVVVVRRLWRRLPREPIPRLPPTTLLQGFPS
jgi:hypothetical protein